MTPQEYAHQMLRRAEAAEREAVAAPDKEAQMAFFAIALQWRDLARLAQEGRLPPPGDENSEA